MAQKIKLRRGLKQDLPVLTESEPGFCTDTGDLYIGSTNVNVHINPVKSVNGKTGDVAVTDITGNAATADKAVQDSAGNIIKDTYLQKKDDISNTKITSLDAISTEFPIPAAGEETKTFMGKMRKFTQDFSNFKTGIMTLGMLVNNTTTNRGDLPAAAGAVYNLQEQVTQLNSDLGETKKRFLYSASTGWSAMQSGSNGLSYRLQLTELGQLRLYKSRDNWSTYTVKVIGDTSDI